MSIDLEAIENIFNKMKRHPIKTTFTIIALTLTALAGFYLQGYLSEKGKQSAITIEASKIITQHPKKQELNKIYQDNKVVGEITGEVKIKGDSIFFEEISETSNLKENIPFEYQKVKYLIKEFQSYSGRKSITTIGPDISTEDKKAVLKGATCVKFK